VSPSACVATVDPDATVEGADSVVPLAAALLLELVEGSVLGVTTALLDSAGSLLGVDALVVGVGAALVGVGAADSSPESGAHASCAK
jgi:hypothetical protein